MVKCRQRGDASLGGRPKKSKSSDSSEAAVCEKCDSPVSSTSESVAVPPVVVWLYIYIFIICFFY